MAEWQVIQGDCLHVLRGMPDASVDAVVTDPPYGCGKAEWDEVFPTAWYAEARRIAGLVCIITGSAGVRDSVGMVGNDFVDIIAARNLNGMTRGPIGYGNWLAAVIAKGKPRMGVNAFDFVVGGDKPDHPSPKPLEYMQKLVLRLTEAGDTVLDPFCGSGTTGMACVMNGRRFIGIEQKAEFCELSRQRIGGAVPLFTSNPSTLCASASLREELPFSVPPCLRGENSP